MTAASSRQGRRGGSLGARQRLAEGLAPVRGLIDGEEGGSRARQLRGVRPRHRS